MLFGRAKLPFIKASLRTKLIDNVAIDCYNLIIGDLGSTVEPSESEITFWVYVQRPDFEKWGGFSYRLQSPP